MFEISFWTFLIVCPLTFLGGFIDSIAGGGGLITLPAYLVAGLPPHLAMGTNKAASFLGTATSCFNYIKEGFVKWKIAIPCMIFALIGSACGTNLALFIEPDVLQVVIIVLLPITAIFTLSSKGLSKKRKEFSYRKTVLIASVLAFFIGGYDGFYGPGTGTFLIILLNLLAHQNLESANGLSKVTNLASNVAAFIVFLINGKVLLLLALAAGICQVIGNYIGSKLFIKKGLKIVRPVMIVVFIALMAKIIFDMLA